MIYLVYLLPAVGGQVEAEYRAPVDHATPRRRDDHAAAGYAHLPELAQGVEGGARVVGIRDYGAQGLDVWLDNDCGLDAGLHDEVPPHGPGQLRRLVG